MLTQIESYQLCDKKFVGIGKIPVNTTSAQIQGFQNTEISFLFASTAQERKNEQIFILRTLQNKNLLDHSVLLSSDEAHSVVEAIVL
jgi:hypothetical protein